MNRLAKAPDVPALDVPHEVVDGTRLAAPQPRVEPIASGRWTVCHQRGKPALSDRFTTNEAEYFAKRRAIVEGIDRVVVHDAY
jgi:hypothetical protein